MERESRRRRFLHPIAISLLFSVLGCATPPAPSLSTPTALAYGDTAAMTRELILGSSREVRLEALGVTFRVPTDHEVEHQALEHFDNVYFDIGTELPVACQIHHRRKDLANFLAYHPPHPLDPPTLSPETRRIAHLGTGAEAGHAFLTLHWVYPGPAGFGIVKQAAANAYDHTIYCRHREPGYEQTFEEVFRTLLSTFLSDHGVDPYYGEIAVIRIGDRPIGIEITEMRRGYDGRSRIDYNQSLLLPRGPGALVATDTQEISFTSEDGDLLRQRARLRQAGMLANDLVLHSASPGRWQVSGVFGGQRYQHAFAAPRPLRSSLGSALDIREQLIDAGTEAEVTSWIWRPEEAPSGASQVRTEVTGTAEHGYYTGVETVGDWQRQLVLDIDGSLVSSRTDMGPATLQMERVWVAGTY